MFQLPTTTSGIEPEQWGVGITGVVLKQKNGWTYGALANHFWSVSDNDTLGKTSDTYLQPFLSYTTKTATSYGINTEATYDWVNDTWSVPINVTVGQIIKVGRLPVQISGGVRYWVESPAGGADEWGLRLGVTYLFPKR